MKFCQPHWDELRKAIDDRGLSGLVAGDGIKAAAAMERELKGMSEPGDYDPLMSAHWAITSAALEAGGLYLMGDNPEGAEYCPLCEAEKQGGSGTASDWITGCCDAQLKHAREQKLVPDVQ